MNLTRENGEFIVVVIEANLVGDSWDWAQTLEQFTISVVIDGYLPPLKKWGIGSM